MRLWDALKARLRFGAWGGQSSAGGYSSWNDGLWYGSYPGSSYDYRAAVGRIQENPIVQACIAWMQRACTEPPLQVVRLQEDGEENRIPKHPLTVLLARPNPFTTGRQLWQQTISDSMTAGNAYWVKVRNDGGEPIELWHIPEHRIRPQWPSSGLVFISHYLHRVNGIDTKLPVEDVVHFRFGKHPDNERLGWSPVLAGLREIACLNEGANYHGALLRNRAVASHLVTSKDPAQPLNKEQAQALEALWISKTSGDGSGRPIFGSIPVDVNKLDYSPADLELGTFQNWFVDTICSLYGLNAMTVALTSGQAHKTYANYAEGREACEEQAVLPTLWDYAETLDLQLLPDLGDPETEKVSFDLTKVRILQEDATQQWKRLDDAVKTGWITPNEARAQVNIPPIEGGDKLQQAGGGGGFGGGGNPFESRGDQQATAPGPAHANGNGRQQQLEERRH
jgi:HK97 family phage portal protein